MRRALVLLALSGAMSSPEALAGDAPGRPAAPPPAPVENSSYVPDDDEDVRRALAAADAAAAAKDWASAVRLLQRVAEGPPHAVVLVSENGVFEGVRVVAHHRVARLGRAGIDAYQREFGGLAGAMLAAAVDRLDLRGLAETADRYLPADEGRTAALLLADLANERGDADDALGWLERLEDLEAVAGPGLEAETARWRDARVRREAVAVARDGAAAARVRATLSAVPPARPAPDDVRRAPDGADWATTGGAPHRARVVPALVPPFVLAWCKPLRETRGGFDDLRRERGAGGGRPSPWLPPRAVVEGDRVYVSDGTRLQVRDLGTGATLAAAPLRSDDDPSFAEDAGGEEGEEARTRWWWIEGHAVSLAPGRALCAVAPAFASLPELEGESGRLPHLAAFDVGGDALRPAWTAGGSDAEGDPLSGVQLHGAPCVYRGTVYCAGIRKTRSDRWESLLVALDPATGAARFVSTLGAGGPVRRKREDEILPGACAAAHGRVLVVTAFGFASCVDAATGRTLWTYRYDRGSPDGETAARRLGSEREEGARHSSFANEPPLISGGRCFLTPTDSRTLYVTFDRPRGPRRLLTGWRHSRTEGFLNFALEHLPGASDGRGGIPPTLVGVGQGYRFEPTELHVCVVAMDVDGGQVRWGRALPDAGAPEPYGRAAVTASEVFVSTRGGIAAFSLKDGSDLPFTGPDALPEELEDARPWGNLVVVPGRGLLAVNGDWIAFWRSR